MPICDDTFATRRHLPHLQRPDKTYFVTFSTIDRTPLPLHARDLALACCVFGHQLTYWLETALIMPDHVHWVITPYECTTLPRVLKTIKGISSRLINLYLRRRGSLWQDESFDRIIRAGEDIGEKCAYIRENPVRAGLVADPDDYPWLWRQWVEGQGEQRILEVLPEWILEKRR